MKVKVLKLDNSSTDSNISLDAATKVYASEVALINRVKNQAEKQGTKKIKTRAQVRGGAAKPYRQKGTGRARQGSTNGPHFIGGGVAHGPRMDTTKLGLNKRYKVNILKRMLEARISNETLNLVELTNEPKALRSFFGAYNKTLLVYSTENKEVLKFIKNLPNLVMISVNNLSAFDLINYSNVMIDSKLESEVSNILSK
jgi:large subunit ribosomal protein L4